MNKIPDGALLQKSKNNVSYVYFPSYYYDKDAKTHNKEKQKRLYIGKVVGVGWGAKFGPEGSSIIGSPSGNPE